MIEMLMAITITATLMTAMLVALDFMFKRYTLISDSASTHVISRTVMSRMLSMLRTGTQFGPSPPGDKLFDASRNPFDSRTVTFVQETDAAGTLRTTLETRPASTVVLGTERVELRGPFVLWLVQTTTPAGGGTPSIDERPLIDGVLNENFINLWFDVGNRVRRATVDLTIKPQGNNAAEKEGSTWRTTYQPEGQQIAVDRRLIAVDPATPTIRLVGSVSPRGQDDE